MHDSLNEVMLQKSPPDASSGQNMPQLLNTKANHAPLPIF